MRMVFDVIFCTAQLVVVGLCIARHEPLEFRKLAGLEIGSTVQPTLASTFYTGSTKLVQTKRVFYATLCPSVSSKGSQNPAYRLAKAHSRGQSECVKPQAELQISRSFLKLASPPFSTLSP